MRKTTYVVHAKFSSAVAELRERLEVSQPELARIIDKQSARGKNGGPKTHQQTISSWENGAGVPSPRNRMALGKIAAKHGHETLAKLFRAPIATWRQVAIVRK